MKGGTVGIKKGGTHHSWTPVGEDPVTGEDNIYRCRLCGMYKCTHRPEPRKGRVNPGLVTEYSDIDGGVIQLGPYPVPPCENRIPLE